MLGKIIMNEFANEMQPKMCFDFDFTYQKSFILEGKTSISSEIGKKNSLIYCEFI